MNAVTEQSPVPSRHSVRTLVESLVGRDVDLTDGDPVPPKATNVVAVYVTDQTRVAAVIVVDIEGGARMGGALGMLPKGGVDDAIAEGTLDGLIRDNCYEVLNVLSAVFNVEGAPHVRLYEMYAPGDGVPGDVASLAQTMGARLDVALAIAGYGSGRLSIVIR